MRTLIVLMLLAGSLPALAQTDSSSRRQEALNLYRRAIQYADLGSASYALNQYLHWGGDRSYEDTLALVYYNNNNLAGAYKLAGELNTRDAKNQNALALLADISGRAGDTKASLEWYEKLCALSPEPFYLYQLATRQFVLERRLECRQTLQKAISDSAKARDQMVRLDLGQGYQEEVPVIAAAMNMLGALAQQEKDSTTAETWYRKALAEHPTFAIAKQNIEDLKPARPQRTPAAKPATPAKPRN